MNKDIDKINEEREVIKKILDLKINQDGFIKSINGFISVINSMQSNFVDTNFHLIAMLEKTREIVITRNKPEEIAYFNQLLSGVYADLSDHLAIENSSI